MLNFKIDDLSVWEKLQETTEPIIMYGTGNGADKVVDIFEKHLNKEVDLKHCKTGNGRRYFSKNMYIPFLKGISFIVSVV